MLHLSLQGSAPGYRPPGANGYGDATMRAVVVHSFGTLNELTVEDIQAPAAEPGEVLIRVGAAGVNFADLLMIAGKYQVEPELPFTPGFEVAGVVESVGGGVAGFDPGDRVVATSWYGGYAERIAVPATAVSLLPDNIDASTAAACSVAFATAYHGLHDRTSIAPGESLLVTGATGGVGSAAVQLGAAMGARVIAAVGSREKEGPARRLGADDVVFYEAERPLREQLAELEPGGIDVIVDPVGGAVFEQAARALAPFGRALVVGFAAGAIPKLATNLVLLKESSVIGVYWGAFREREPRRAAEHLAEIWQLMSDGAVQPPPITQAPLEDAARVLGKLADRKMIGRAVLLPNSPNMDDSR